MGLVIGFQNLFAQQNLSQSRKKCTQLALQNDTYLLTDSLTILFSKIEIKNIPDSLVEKKIDHAKNQVSFQIKSKPDFIEICYYTLPYSLHKQYFKRNFNIYDSVGIYQETRKPYDFKEKKEELFATQGINKTGNITRGISFGNNQDVFVNSSLNLQMQGQLTKDIKITAAISDQNIPLQPDGTTQNIQQFDRVYTQFDFPIGKVLAGDVLLKDKNAYFLRYQRNVQGLYGEVAYPMFNGKQKGETSAGLSFAKGKFSSQFLNIVEGVQGPYKIVGPNNERFIIILANSEKVFLDGKELKRGFDFDYTIDYNLSEIRFNPGIIITKFSRIRIDFEYSERNFSRASVTAYHKQSFGEKAEVYGQYYVETDDPNAPITQSLSQKDKNKLRAIGDSVEKAFLPGIDSVGFIQGQILYKKLINTTLGQNFEYYQYSNSPDSARYRLVFADLGFGKGNYIQKQSIANGRIYQFVSPINGIPVGRYEPIKILPLPTQKQVFSTGAKYNLSKNDYVFVDYAISHNDDNLFSDFDKANDDGMAIKLGYMNKGRNINFIKDYKWTGSADYEVVSARFNPIDRYRSPEFDRDWNTFSTKNTFWQGFSEDQIFNTSLGVKKDVSNFILYSLGVRNKINTINGVKNEVQLNKSISNFYLISNFSNLQAQRPDGNAEWNKLIINPFIKTKLFTPGYSFTLDKNTVKANQKDSAIFSAMNYEEHKIYVKSPDSSKHTFLLEYAYRAENAPLKGKMVAANTGQSFSFSTKTNLSSQTKIGFSAVYRKLDNLVAVPSQSYNPNNIVNRADQLQTSQLGSTENISGRLDVNQTFFDKILKADLVYLVLSSRDQRREYIYVKVPTGQGNFAWRDDNKDGTEQLNEFYPAINFDEKNYLRYFLPTDQFIPVFQNSLNIRTDFTPPKTWKEKSSFLKFASRWSNTSSLVIDRKVSDFDIEKRFNPFATLDPKFLLSATQNLRSNLFFNRMYPAYGGELGYTSVNQKLLLANGFEEKTRKESIAMTRFNFLSYFNSKLFFTLTDIENRSDFLLNRNYFVKVWQIKTELAFQPYDYLRFSTMYAYSQKRNILPEINNETCNANELQFETRFSKLTNRTIQAAVKWTGLAYKGDANSPVAYEMLEALRPGNNFTWSVNWQQRLTNGLMITLNYEGRSSEDQKIVHIARMQVSALF